jgi:hypothetical protein
LLEDFTRKGDLVRIEEEPQSDIEIEMWIAHLSQKTTPAPTGASSRTESRSVIASVT